MQAISTQTLAIDEQRTGAQSSGHSDSRKAGRTATDHDQVIVLCFWHSDSSRFVHEVVRGFASGERHFEIIRDVPRLRHPPILTIRGGNSQHGHCGTPASRNQIITMLGVLVNIT